MGGDGGVIATNRRYMRHAGSADQTGDSTKSERPDAAIIKQEQERAMQECTVSGQALQFGKEPIVVCPYGRLYHKEAAVQALIRRKQGTDDLGPHIRSLKDLKLARFELNEAKLPICPITSTQLNGNIPAVVIVPGSGDAVNVVSIKGLDLMKEEFEPYDRKIRLAPPPTALRTIKEELEESRNLERKKKKKKKRKHGETSSGTVKVAKTIDGIGEQV